MNVKKHIDKFLQSPYSSCSCRSFTINWQETDGAWVEAIKLYHSMKRKTISPNFWGKMKVRALEELRKAKARAGRYEILVWHKESLMDVNVGTLVILRKKI